eukprot:SM000062S19909  [mRNA]  locus=s62:312605:314211:+ [translate_table: standard]
MFDTSSTERPRLKFTHNIHIAHRSSSLPIRLDNRCRRVVVGSTSSTDVYSSSDSKLQYVKPDVAKKLVDTEGYTVVDIRDERQYKKAHIVNSEHIPLFVENTDSDVATLVRRQAHNNFAGLLYGLAFTKDNDNFISTFEQKFKKDSKLLVVCQEGLRSASAADKLKNAGFKDVAIITSGLQKVPNGLFPKEGRTELKDAGKGGIVSIQTPISIVLATLLFGAYAFISLFPEQAAELPIFRQ